MKNRLAKGTKSFPLLAKVNAFSHAQPKVLDNFLLFLHFTAYVSKNVGKIHEKEQKSFRTSAAAGFVTMIPIGLIPPPCLTFLVFMSTCRRRVMCNTAIFFYLCYGSLLLGIGGGCELGSCVDQAVNHRDGHWWNSPRCHHTIHEQHLCNINCNNFK